MQVGVVCMKVVVECMRVVDDQPDLKDEKH